MVSDGLEEDIMRLSLHNTIKHDRVFIRWCERATLFEWSG